MGINTTHKYVYVSNFRCKRFLRQWLSLSMSLNKQHTTKIHRHFLNQLLPFFCVRDIHRINAQVLSFLMGEIPCTGTFHLLGMASTICSVCVMESRRPQGQLEGVKLSSRCGCVLGSKSLHEHHDVTQHTDKYSLGNYSLDVTYTFKTFVIQYWTSFRYEFSCPMGKKTYYLSGLGLFSQAMHVLVYWGPFYERRNICARAPRRSARTSLWNCSQCAPRGVWRYQGLTHDVMSAAKGNRLSLTSCTSS